MDGVGLKYGGSENPPPGLPPYGFLGIVGPACACAEAGPVAERPTAAAPTLAPLSMSRRLRSFGGGLLVLSSVAIGVLLLTARNRPGSRHPIRTCLTTHARRLT